MCHKYALGRLMDELINSKLVTPVSVYLSVNIFNHLLKTTGPIKPDSFTDSNLCLLLQKEQNVKGGEGPSGKQAVGISNGTR